MAARRSLSLTEFVDHRRGEGGVDFDAGQRGVAHDEVRHRLAPDFACVNLLDAAAHLTQHFVQARTGGIEADVLDRQLAARHDQRGDGEEGGGRGIAGDFDGLRAQLGLTA
jgi:hypothetical protein